MTPLEYAQRCAAALQLDKLVLRGRIMGRGHEPRVRVERSRPFLRLLQVEHICTTRRGGVQPFTLASIEARYRTQLLSAGLNPDATQPQAFIISRRHWQTALGYHRLTGELLAPDEAIARRVAGVLKRRHNQFFRELQAERVLQEAALKKLREQEAAALAVRGCVRENAAPISL